MGKKGEGEGERETDRQRNGWRKRDGGVNLVSAASSYTVTKLQW